MKSNCRHFFVIIALFILLPNVTYGGIWYDVKVNANKLMFWKNKHLSEVGFKDIYPKAFYKKSYFGLVITGTTIVAAGAFTYFTAGAGAPAAATGVSTVASWVAGGGAGSYMAGLSTIGGWFGGNAILGASILNGLSMGIIGGGTEKFITMSILSKLSVIASVTASSLDGVFIFMNPQTDKIEYRIRVKIPKNIGSKATRDIVDKIYDNEDEINEAYSDENMEDQNKLFKQKEHYYKKAIALLEKLLDKKGNFQEDFLALGIIAWNTNNYSLFIQAMQRLNSKDLENYGFINYLLSLKDISQGRIGDAFKNLDNSIAENEYAIEPILLYINLLGNKEFNTNEPKILQLVEIAEDNFNSNKYSTSYSLTALYYRVGTFYFLNERYVNSQVFYEYAYDSLGFMQKHFFGKKLRNIIKLGVANSLYQQNKIRQSKKIYNDIIDGVSDRQEKESLQSQYIGNKS